MASPSPHALAAKAVRADIAASDLPPHPDGITFKVSAKRERARISTYLIVLVDVLDVPSGWLERDPDGPTNLYVSAAAQQLETALRSIAYQRWGSGAGESVSVQFHRAR